MNKVRKKLDPRVIKTQKIIKKVFLELMQEIGFHKINVRILVERAEINRSTFYLHYVDKFDILNKIEDELFLDMKNIAVNINMDRAISNSEKPISEILKIAEYVKENKEIFTLLMSEKGDPAFINRYNEMMKSVLFKNEMIDLLSIPQQYAFAAITGMMSTLFSEWIKSGLRETPEEYVQIVIKIIDDMPRHIFNN